MDIILVHLGGNIPDYMQDCIKQIRKFTADKVIVVVDTEQVIHFENDVIVVQKSALFESAEWVRFKRLNHFSQFNDNFWKYACERFYVIESVMDMFNIDHALHLENDNLIYGDIDAEYLNKKCGKSIGITKITKTLSGAGIMYVGSYGAIKEFNRKMNDLMSLSKEDRDSKYGDEMQNEMRLMNIVTSENKDLVKYLDIEPCRESKYVYDCASWGQYIGGTCQNPNQPYTTEAHIVGKAIIEGHYDCKWIDKKPYVVDAEKSIKPLFNLHIHSKQLGIWVS